MKSYPKWSVVLILMMCVSIGTFAQANLEEVVYTKDGSIYRGIIVEQIPNESVKVKIMGGSVINIPLANVLKFTKEERQRTPQSERGKEQMYNPMNRNHFQMRKPALYTPKLANGKEGKPFYYKPKGYFFYAELAAGWPFTQGRLINGYKFGRMGYLGVAIGIDAQSLGNNMFGDRRPQGGSGIFLPLALHYEGDFLKRKTTPYIEAELGYAMKTNFPFGMNRSDQNVKNYGGPMGSLGIGVKFFTRTRLNFKLTPMVNFKSNKSEITYNGYDPFYGYERQRRFEFGIGAGIKFAVGF